MTYDELCTLAITQRDKALREIRDAFHWKWGTYRKCGVCGGRVETMVDTVDKYDGKKCIHGDHACVVITNGYSYFDRDIDRKIRSRHT